MDEDGNDALAAIGDAFLAGGPLRGDHRGFAVEQLVAAIVAGARNWSEADAVAQCRRLNRRRCLPRFGEDELRARARQALDRRRRHLWREVELLCWLDQPGLPSPRETFAAERQLLVLGEAVDALLSQGHGDETVLRECLILNARAFVPPLDPGPMAGFVRRLLRLRASDGLAPRTPTGDPIAWGDPGTMGGATAAPEAAV